jgi:ABC-type spermidine/putrescine transport system permease subunit II
MADQAGLIGAVLGAIIGLVQYKIVTGAVTKALQRTDRSTTQAEKDDYERRIRLFRAIMLVLLVGGTPILGFGLGRTLFG